MSQKIHPLKMAEVQGKNPGQIKPTDLAQYEGKSEVKQIVKRVFDNIEDKTFEVEAFDPYWDSA